MDKNKPKFVHVTYINTTPEKLWAALTTADFTQKYWMGQRIQSALPLVMAVRSKA